MSSNGSAIINDKTRFSMGMVTAIVGAVITATFFFARIQAKQEEQASLIHTQAGLIQTLSQKTAGQAEEFQKLNMDFRLFLQKYDQDMNRYIRDRRETTLR